MTTIRFARAGLALATLLFLHASSNISAAQPLPAALPPNPSSGQNLAAFFTAKTPYEFWLTCVIGFLGLVIIGALLVALKPIRPARAEDIARPVIVVTVVIGTLILVTAGYNNEQIAPAFGLFGTVVGYMLGRLPQPQASTDARSDQPATSSGSSVQEISRGVAQDEARSAAR